MDVLKNEVQRFSECAKRFIALIDEHEKHSAPQFVRNSAEAIAAVYMAGLALPDVQPDSNGPLSSTVDSECWWRLFEAIQGKLGPCDRYQTVFNPYGDNEEPVTGSLADDLCDVYRELQAGRAVFERGRESDHLEAAWHWRWGLLNHWGQHAVEALRASQAIISGYALEED